MVERVDGTGFCGCVCCEVGDARVAVFVVGLGFQGGGGGRGL